jgi:2,3-bisphosphoglycerate-dependent phosphoglycerate mutase
MRGKTTRVLLIRHGQSQGNAESRFGGHSATALSAMGRQQAHATARALSTESITAIYSSDLLRAVETAEPLASSKRLEINTTPALRERNIGIMEGLTFEEAAARHPEEYAALIRRDLDYVMSGGESYKQMLDRSWQFLESAINRHKHGAIAIFSHTGTISILTLHIMGALDAPNLKPVWIHTANCGISRFEIQDGGLIRVTALNDTRHLQGI